MSEESDDATPIDANQLAADLEAAVSLRQIAALAGEFYDALRACNLPDGVIYPMLRDWHAWVLSQESESQWYGLDD